MTHNSVPLLSNSRNELISHQSFPSVPFGTHCPHWPAPSNGHLEYTDRRAASVSCLPWRCDVLRWLSGNMNVSMMNTTVETNTIHMKKLRYPATQTSPHVGLFALLVAQQHCTLVSFWKRLFIFHMVIWPFYVHVHAFHFIYLFSIANYISNWRW